jgi:integrase
MRIRLKGINSKSKRLADGTVKTYWYAWKGGPRIEGQPGTPEFIASYNAAVAKKVESPAGRLLAIFARFDGSAEFNRLAERTKADYRQHLTAIERRFGDFPLSGLSDRRARSIFLEWRDELAKRSLRQADYAWTIFARVLSWALDRGLIIANPCERGGRLYRASRVDHVWTDDDEARFLAVASPPLGLAFLMAIWTGQRQGDLLRLPWAAYDGSTIRLRQSKTGARVSIPVSAALKAALAAEKRRSPIILTNQDGRPWTADGFRSSWRKTCAKAGITDLTFHDLRGTAVTRLALAGCTESEIAAFTGHSLSDVRSILDVHYLHRDPALAESAVRKLERRTKTPD